MVTSCRGSRNSTIIKTLGLSSTRLFSLKIDSCFQGFIRQTWTGVEVFLPMFANSGIFENLTFQVENFSCDLKRKFSGLYAILRLFVPYRAKKKNPPEPLLHFLFCQTHLAAAEPLWPNLTPLASCFTPIGRKPSRQLIPAGPVSPAILSFSLLRINLAELNEGAKQFNTPPAL